MIDVRRWAEESIAADLALERAGRQVGMGLARGFAFDAGNSIQFFALTPARLRA